MRESDVETKETISRAFPSAEKMRFFVNAEMPSTNQGETYERASKLAEERILKWYPALGALSEHERAWLIHDYLEPLLYGGGSTVRGKIDTWERPGTKSRKGTQHLDILFEKIETDAKARVGAFRNKKEMLGKFFDSEMTEFSTQFLNAFEDFADLMTKLPELKVALQQEEAMRKVLGKKHQQIVENKFMSSSEKKTKQAEIQIELLRHKKLLEYIRWKVALAEAGAHLIPDYDKHFAAWKEGRTGSEDALRDEFHREALSDLLRKIFVRLVRRTGDEELLKRYDPTTYEKRYAAQSPQGGIK